MPNQSSKLISLMFVIGRRMRDEMKQSHQQSNASWLHFETLRYVRDAKRPTMRDVAAHFLITPPAATLLVDGLVASKLLRRIVDKKDRRAVHITLTPRGKKIMEQGIRTRMEKMKELFSVLNTKEQGELIRILTKIAQAS